MAYKSLVPGVELADAKAERAEAKRLGQYRVSRSALFVPAFPFDQYIPLSTLRRAWIQNATLPTTGCCGKQLPVVLVRAQYECGGKLDCQNMTFEGRSMAEEMLAVLAAACPELETQPPETPVRGKVR